MQVALGELMLMEAPTWVVAVEAQVQPVKMEMVPHHHPHMEELVV
jgi:hypothetical protein